MTEIFYWVLIKMTRITDLSQVITEFYLIYWDDRTYWYFLSNRNNSNHKRGPLVLYRKFKRSNLAKLDRSKWILFYIDTL